MKTEKLRKGLSLLLAVIMLLTMMPATGIIPEAEAASPVIKAYISVPINNLPDHHAYRSSIVTATFLDYIDEEAVAQSGSLNWNIAADGSGSVKSWLLPSSTSPGMYDLYIGGDGGITANANSTNFFYFYSNLKEINGLELLDTSNTTNFSCFFEECASLETLDLTCFDTSNATDMSYMFSGCKALLSVNLKGWDTSKVKNMSYMFNMCITVPVLDLSGFDTGSVTNTFKMFYRCEKMTTLYTGDKWNMDNVTSSEQMFNCCYVITGKKSFSQVPSPYNKQYATTEGFLTYKAPEVLAEYSVTYVFEGETPEGATLPAELKYNEGSKIDVADAPSAEGYVFNGWTTTDTTVDENGKFTVDNNITFTGTWSKLYNVSYEYAPGYIVPDGAPALPADADYIAGTTVSVEGVLPDVGRYIFVGWTTADADVTGDNFIMPENDVVLYGYYKIPVESVEVKNAPDELVLNKTDDFIIDVYVTPDDATIKGIVFESDNPDVAEVDEYGKITAKEEGTTTITVYSADDPAKKDTITVTVKIPVTELTVDKEEFILNEGDGGKITATVTPDNATNKKVIYESADDSIVTVDENGNIKAITEGETKIYVYPEDNPSLKKEIPVTVKVPVKEITAPDRITLNVDEIKNIGAEVNEDATNKTLIYITGDKNIAYVDSDGVITARKPGTVTVYITSEDNPEITKEVIVTVVVPVEDITVEKNEITLTEGDKDTIKVTVTPDNATNKELTYESSDETVVKVDEKGNIEAVGEGEATITVTSKDDPTKTETVKVTVNKKIFKVTYAFVGEVIPDKVTAPAMKEYKDGTAVKVEADAAADRYIFSGWSTDDAAVANGEFVISNDVHFIGSWTKINYYNVTYKYEGDIPENAPAVPGDAEYKEGTKVTIEKAPYVEGYEFIGWSTNDTTVNEKGEFNIYNDVELVGTWRKINYYNVTYKYEGDIPENAPAVPEAKSYEENTVVTVAGVPSVDRYIFSGWTTDDTNPVDGKFNIRNDVEFIGKWTKINYYTVTYWFVGEDIPEEAELPAEKEYKEGTEVTVADVPYVEGYTFAGWTLTTDGVTITDGDFVINKNVDFIGTWTKNEVEEPTPEEPTPEEPTPEEPTPEEPTPEEPEYVIETPEKLEIKEGLTELIYVKVTPDDGTQKPTFSSADESIAKVDEFGNVTGVKAGTTTIYVSFPNGEIRPVTVTVLAPVAPGVPSIPKTHYVCFGKTDGIGWYEVSVNGGDFFPQGPNSTLEVQEGSVLVIRTQDMWIDDEFDFYVNGDRVESVANTITVVVDGYMLIGALSMDVEVPDVDESLNLFQRIIRAIKNFFASIGDWFAKIFS